MHTASQSLSRWPTVGLQQVLLIRRAREEVLRCCEHTRAESGYGRVETRKTWKGALGIKSRKNQKEVIGCEEPITRLGTPGLTGWI